ncbi:MAG TPA: FecR domain-containing protein [Mucilaginibacter sp.]|jgi:ferric-dicitrate binding protein FerR (iron transport regulator)
MADNTRIQELAHRYKNGIATADEKAEFESWLSTNRDEPIDVPDNYAASESEAKQRMLLGIHERIQQTAKTVRLWPRIAAAASVLVGLSVGGYFILHKKPVDNQIAQNQHQDFAPGKNQATLTLANGQKIIITKGMKGRLAKDITVDSTAIAYQTSDNIEYNTLTTKRGEASPYPLELPDGTKVWLNAASSVTFPTRFTKNREVTITGEALFEVKPDALHPFSVKAGTQTIEDIGTTFDVNSYLDEPAAKTTLVEGSVRINHQVILKPGEQSIFANNKLTVSNANVEAVLAWKNGAFDFKHTDVPSVMRQISRWYNVDIIYEGAIPTTTITGKVYRNTNASNALKIVKLLGINYKIEGNQIIITNK